MNAEAAADACSRMLRSECPECIGAILGMIDDTGIDPWQVALRGEADVWNHLCPLGVNPAEMPALILATDSEIENRAYAAHELKAFPGSRVALRALLKLAGDRDSSVRSSAVASLTAFQDATEVLDILLELSEDSDESVCQVVASALGGFPQSTQALNALLLLTMHWQPEVCESAVYSLWCFAPSGEALARLLVLAKDADYYVKVAVACALRGFIDSQEALYVVVGFLRTDQWMKPLYWAAADSLIHFPNSPMKQVGLEDIRLDQNQARHRS